jgi:hypothetical protein
VNGELQILRCAQDDSAAAVLRVSAAPREPPSTSAARVTVDGSRARP